MGVDVVVVVAVIVEGVCLYVCLCLCLKWWCGFGRVCPVVEVCFYIDARPDVHAPWLYSTICFRRLGIEKRGVFFKIRQMFDAVTVICRRRIVRIFSRLKVPFFFATVFLVVATLCGCAGPRRHWTHFVVPGLECLPHTLQPPPPLPLPRSTGPKTTSAAARGDTRKTK